MGKFNDDTCFLFADPSFLTGVATVLDISGTLLTYNESKSEREADWRAIASDWYITGKDIKASVEKFEQDAPQAE